MAWTWGRRDRVGIGEEKGGWRWLRGAAALPLLWCVAASLPAQDGGGAVSGRITDVDGHVIGGATVTLTDASGRKQVSKTDAAGRYSFSGAAAGNGVIEAVAAGFADGQEPVPVLGLSVAEAPVLPLRAGERADVEVRASQDEILTEEVKVEETQRLFGAIPNFFVAYDWKAPPLKAKQKFELSYRQTFDPVTVMINEITAGAEEAGNVMPGYGKGGNGFVKRAAALQADTAIGTFAGGVLYPVIFRQDPRYFYMGPSRTKTRRFFYALSSAVICRGDNGKWQPNYSSVLGDLTAGAAANAYAEGPDRNGWHTVIEGGLLGAAFDGVGNVVQEFLYKKLTPHSPDYGSAAAGAQQ